MNPERTRSMVKAADQLMEQKARELVNTFYEATRYRDWEEAKRCAELSLISSAEWVKSVHAYYKETHAMTTTIGNMIAVVKGLRPLDYGEKKKPISREELRAARGCGHD